MKSKKTIQERYQMLSPIQHVLKRPDTYVGSLDKQTERQWVLNEEGTGFIEKTLSYSPALYKIYDEVLVNAADNYQRDKSMDYLNIEINQTEGFVRVHNNGKGIPIVIHKENNMYIPQMIFGHLLTGSNFDDQNDQRFGGGRNGFGAKLANILSTKFSVQCGDSQNKKHFYMSWLNNMGQPQQAIVKDYKKKDFVEIVFYPDFKRFGMEKFESDIVQLFVKRAYDMAGVLAKVKVVLNGSQIPIKVFNDYVDMYLGKSSQQHHPIKVIAGKDSNNDTWQVILSRSDGQLKQVSFVNSICTYKGGTHVNYILDQIIPKISDKLKNTSIKTHLIKSKLFVFINCLIINPKFDSQLKETLTTRPNSFGSSWEMPEKMIKSILATGIVQQLSQEAQARQMTKMAKVTAGGKKVRLIDVPKLQDANDAGTAKSEHCVLILTEGDSAKALAVSGLSVVGRDKYGVFPLRGKLLNVREKDKKAVLQNAQISNIVKIIGLQYNRQYTDRKSLRYGSIMIMTDQDADGSHIKGLIINFVNYYWPSLFKTNGFLRQFITPLLKVIKGQQSHSFFTSQQYKVWANDVQNIKAWKIKYYKGLGTSTSKEGQQYFSNINNHEKIFRYEDEQDTVKIDMAFSKKKADQRKEWLANYDPEDIIELSPANKEIQYKHFIDKELKHFSNSNNRRAIPSLVDGFKPGQRKILFACFKRNLKDQIKVAQLAGYVAEHSAYHHGQMSLTMTIVLLAQNFVGSNNINLLMPNGQFGSRAEGGQDHASARYIFTCLNRITRVIFPQADDHTLKYLEDDGQLVEPQFYAPIIPMILVNGVQGLGTGWATKIPNFNPRQIVEQLKRRMNGEPFTKILPWYKDFEGQTVESSTGVTFRGIMSQDSSRSNVLHVTQLPVGKWNIQFKQTLNELITKKKHVSGYRQYHTQDKVHFEIDFEQDYLQKDEQQGYDKIFDLLKMSTKKNTANMVAFNVHNHITKYQSSVQIMNQYFDIRMEYYVKRKDYLVSKLQREVQIISMKTKFILAVVENKLEVRNVKKKMICQKMLELGFLRYSELTVIKTTKKAVVEKKNKNDDDGVDDNIEDNQNEEESGAIKTSDFDYLLSMQIWNLTQEKVQSLKTQMNLKQTELEILKNTKQSVMWLNDLNQFLKVLDEVQTQQRQQKLKAEQAAKAVKKVNKQKQGKKIKKKNQSQSQDGSPNKKKDNKKDATQLKNQNKKRKPSETTSKTGSEIQKQVSQNSLTADTPFKQLVRSGRQDGQKRNRLKSKTINNLKSKPLSESSSEMFKQTNSKTLFTKPESKQKSQSSLILKQKIQKHKQKQAKNKVMNNQKESENSQDKELI